MANKPGMVADSPGIGGEANGKNKKSDIEVEANMSKDKSDMEINGPGISVEANGSSENLL